MLTPLAAQAQDENSDRGFIQGLLEDALSAPGREVRLEGFAGALSSRATIDKITVTDPEGVWFTAKDVALVWNRSALLRGAVEIEEISVKELSLPRKPLPGEAETPSPEASGAFSLPDLPVSVNIAEMRIDKAIIGAPVFGEAAQVAFTGSARLAGGAGEADLAIKRLDKEGNFTLTGAYDNTSRDLALDLDLTEPADGLAANLLNLPGRPSVELSVSGAAPITDFTADVRLATDGEERLAGTVELITDEDGTSRFIVDLGGDLAPVFVPEFEDFLGREVRLAAEGARGADGALSLDRLLVQAAALRLEGSARIGADGWPEKLALDGSIRPPDGERVILPLPGAETSVKWIALTGGFDAAAGDAWTLEGRAEGFRQPGLEIATLGFSGAGEINRRAESVSGALKLDADGLAPGDAALARALGEAIEGVLKFGWARGAPLRLHEIALSGADYGLSGTMVVGNLDSEEPLTLVPDVTLQAQDLARFADLAGIALAGAAELAIDGRVAPLTGVFDLSFDGTTRNLATGIAQLDPLLDGDGRLSLSLVRDETGLRADPLDISTDHARITGSADLRTGQSRLDITAQVVEVSRALPGLVGPAEVTAIVVQDAATWNIRADASLPGATNAGFIGQITGADTEDLLVSGKLTAAVGRLQAYSALAGRALSGGANLSVTGSGDPRAMVFDLTAEGSVQEPRFGVPLAEALLRGRTDFTLSLARDAQGEVTIRRAVIDGRDIDASIAGGFGDQTGEITYDVKVSDLALALPELPGSASLTGTATRSGEVWTVQTDATLPGDTGASFRGSFTGDGQEKLLAEGRLEARVARLSAFSPLVGRQLSGAVSLTAEGSGDLLTQSFDLTANGTATNLSFGLTTAEAFLRGTTRFDLSATRDGTGAVTIRNAVVDAPGLDAEVSGSFGPDQGRVTYRLSVADLGLAVPDLPGPANLSGTAEKQGNTWSVDASGKGPGGVEVAVRGRVAADASRLDLSANGMVPLALANRRLKGQALSGFVRFDLSVNGPPAISSISGRLSVADAQLTAPALGVALNGITGQADLAAGRADLGLSASLSTGGRIRVSGPISLTPPYTAQLVADLINVVLRDASLYEAQLAGRITLDGPLAGGARIGGVVDLEEAEMRIPSLGPSYSALDGLRHVNPSAEVRRTLRFAGLEQVDPRDRAGPDYPLDLLVRAPNQLFVRGRGLDAELGGELRLTGSTSDIVPVGGFSLIRGRLDLLGRRLTLTQGDVRMRGSFDPVIAFEATSVVDDVTVTLRIEGLASEPELTVTSSPAMPEDEALSFFLFGRDKTSISPLQAVQLAAAIRTLTGQGGLGLTGSLREGLGVDDLDLSTDADGNAEARVGKYLSENIYTDVTVSSEGSTEIQLNFDLTPNVTVRGRLGSDGDTGLGIFYERDY